jgi:CYTH domain-containing protein
MVIMKKVLTTPEDLSSLEESVIQLTQEEFDALEQVPGRRIHKHRYYIPYQGLTIEVDLFQEKLK